MKSKLRKKREENEKKEKEEGRKKIENNHNAKNENKHGYFSYQDFYWAYTTLQNLNRGVHSNVTIDTWT